jgi:hypothetical protein
MYSIMNDAYARAAIDEFKSFFYILRQKNQKGMCIPATVNYETVGFKKVVKVHSEILIDNSVLEKT